MQFYIFPYYNYALSYFLSVKMNKNKVISIGYRLHCKANHRIMPEKGVAEHRTNFDLGRSRSYMQGISSGRALPSMTKFLAICDYLEMTPKDFFNEGNSNPTLLHQLLQSVNGKVINRHQHIIRSRQGIDRIDIDIRRVVDKMCAMLTLDTVLATPPFKLMIDMILI